MSNEPGTEMAMLRASANRCRTCVGYKRLIARCSLLIASSSRNLHHDIPLLDSDVIGLGDVRAAFEAGGGGWVIGCNGGARLDGHFVAPDADLRGIEP